jgi:hypothetical protein
MICCKSELILKATYEYSKTPLMGDDPLYLHLHSVGYIMHENTLQTVLEWDPNSGLQCFTFVVGFSFFELLVTLQLYTV